MRKWTLAQIKSKIQRDLDLQDEDFIQEDELVEYINEGIDMCEAHIHTLYEDYFLTSTTLSWVSGTAEYALPDDIYADKVRGLLYNNGTTIFEIPRIKDKSKFLKAALLKEFPPTLDYAYIIKNSSGEDPKIVFFPTVQETSSNVTLWYLRNASELSADTDTCDIPEFVYYVIQYAKVRCYEKEVGHPNYEPAKQELARLEELMVSTLEEMVPDADNEIEKDMTTYWEMS